MRCAWGMTGSGKTGLCIGLLEEAAIDGVLAIVIDPKGNIANLRSDDLHPPAAQLAWSCRCCVRSKHPTQRSWKTQSYSPVRWTAPRATFSPVDDGR